MNEVEKASICCGVLGLVIAIVALGLGIDCEVHKGIQGSSSSLGTIATWEGTNTISDSLVQLNPTGIFQCNSNYIDMSAQGIIDIVTTNLLNNGKRINSGLFTCLTLPLPISSTTATSLFDLTDTNAGSLILGENTITAGNVIRFVIDGNLSASGSDTITLNLLLNSTSLATISSTITTDANQTLHLQGSITFYATGCIANLTNMICNGTSSSIDGKNGSLISTTTSVDNTIDIEASWTSGSGTFTMTAANFYYTYF